MFFNSILLFFMKGIGRKLFKFASRLDQDFVDLIKFNKRIDSSEDVAEMSSELVFCPKYDDCAKVLTHQALSLLLGVSRLRSANFPDVRLFTHYESFEVFVNNLRKPHEGYSRNISVLYSDTYAAGHYSGLSISIENSKINFLYFDSVGMDCNIRKFFYAFTTIIPDENKGVFAGYCSNKSQSKLQQDSTNCAYFSTAFLKKLSKAKNLDESLAMIGFSKTGLDEERTFEEMKLWMDELTRFYKSGESYSLANQLIAFLNHYSAGLEVISSRILKFAQMDFSKLIDPDKVDELKKLTSKHTYKVASFDDESLSFTIKTHNRAILDFKLNIFKLCTKFLSENQVDEELLVSNHLNNSNYQLQM